MSSENPNLRALEMLRGSKENPNPRLAWELDMVVVSDLVIKQTPKEK